MKAIVINGEYGSGKTCLLQWLHRDILPKRQIRSFYFDNPGVQFYDLANMLLRTIGRKDFAKFIWELAGSYVTVPYPRSLFQEGFEKYLFDAFRSHRTQPDMTKPLQDAILKAQVTTDEEIAHCLARIVTETIKQPYFEYRDFVPRSRGSVVPEGEEAPYFGAILKTILQGTSAKAIAFLIDEFEEIGLQKRLSKRAAHGYLATLKRLINLAENAPFNFWIVLSMTPDAYQTTEKLEPSLVARIADRKFDLKPLTPEKDRVEMMLSDVRDSEPQGAGNWEARVADARTIPAPDASYSAVITSPPYPNRHDYTRIFGIELMFAFHGWEANRALRYQSFHSHPEARPKRPPAKGYEAPKSLERNICHVRDQRMQQMLRGYFFDMYLCLCEVERVCRAGGKAAFVVGNARYDGSVIPVDEYSAEIGERAGLICREIRVVRWRGNSAQQMGKYGRVASRESVVLFEKR